MMKGSWPKVLIVSVAPFGTSTATGITMMNLFSDWPRESLAQIYDDDHEPDLDAGRAWRYSSNDIAAIGFIKRIKYILKRLFSRNLGVPGPVKNVVGAYSLQTAFSDILPINLPVDLLDWVEKFNPDVIYTTLGGVRVINTVLALSHQFSVPIVPHFMDDWPNTTYRVGSKLIIPRIVLKRKLLSVLTQSPLALTICDDMSVSYAKRYGGNYHGFMNCVDIKPSYMPDPTRHGIKLGYIGGLHLNRWRSLLSVVSAAQALQNEGNEIDFEIYIPLRDFEHYQRLFKEFSVVKKMTSVSADTVSDVLSGLDILVHVESFRPDDAAYTRLSISTKIPQYMASSKPIFGYGPENISSIKYILSSNAGVCVTSEGDINGLLGAMRELLFYPDMRSVFAKNGRAVAESRHDAISERRRFFSVICDAIKQNHVAR
ncbi:MAG: hypothetical protein V4730_05270 [Pseudomonadota bacterium]